jgi:hypothetical protein
MGHMKRREFITLFGGAAATWPFAVRAQQAKRMRRIGVLHTGVANDPIGQARNAALLQKLNELGWNEGRNVRVDVRWPAADADQIRKHVTELVAFEPDVILAVGSATVGPLLKRLGPYPSCL